jgi:hypothetical protein
MMSDFGLLSNNKKMPNVCEHVRHFLLGYLIFLGPLSILSKKLEINVLQI